MLPVPAHANGRQGQLSSPRFDRDDAPVHGRSAARPVGSRSCRASFFAFSSYSAAAPAAPATATATAVCCAAITDTASRRFRLLPVVLPLAATRALSSWLLLLLPPRVLVASSAASRAAAVNCRLKPRGLLLRLVSSCFSCWRCWRLALVVAAAAAAPVRVSCSCTTLCREPFHLPPTGVWYACTGATRALPLCRDCCCCCCFHRRACSWPPARSPVQKRHHCCLKHGGAPTLSSSADAAGAVAQAAQWQNRSHSGAVAVAERGAERSRCPVATVTAKEPNQPKQREQQRQQKQPQWGSGRTTAR